MPKQSLPRSQAPNSLEVSRQVIPPIIRRRAKPPVEVMPVLLLAQQPVPRREAPGRDGPVEPLDRHLEPRLGLLQPPLRRREVGPWGGGVGPGGIVVVAGGNYFNAVRCCGLLLLLVVVGGDGRFLALLLCCCCGALEFRAGRSRFLAGVGGGLGLGGLGFDGWGCPGEALGALAWAAWEFGESYVSLGRRHVDLFV